MNTQVLTYTFDYMGSGMEITIKLVMDGCTLEYTKHFYRDCPPDIDWCDGDVVAQYIMDEIWATGVRPS